MDTDVHHGDGSQDVFYHDPDTLYYPPSIEDGRHLVVRAQAFLMKQARPCGRGHEY